MIDWTWILIEDEHLGPPDIVIDTIDDPNVLLYQRVFNPEGYCDCEPEEMYLYRAYNDDDVLLYIGITNDPAQRLWDYSESKWWWPQVTQVVYSWVADHRCVAEAVERDAIRVEHPLYNIEHTAHHNGYRHPSRY